VRRLGAWLGGHWQLLVLTGLMVALWETGAILPLKILVVFFHELSHGVAALATGGEIVSISVSADQGGVAVTRGGSRVLILSAGYVGSLLCGVVLLVAGLRSQADRAVVGLLGGLMLLVTALYIRELFAVGFGLATGVGMLAMAWFLPHQVNDLALRLIGLTSLIYAPRDIISDTIARSHLRSDAFMLGEHLGGGAMFWGVIWLAISFVVIGLCLRFGLGSASNMTRADLRRDA
jgi:hypothetical protein